MDSGYIKLFRKIQDNKLWTESAFTRGQAWIDLLLLANYKDGGYWLRGIFVPVLRGEVGWSEIRLTKRWRWSRNKVRRFLDFLKNEGQIERKMIQQNKYLSSLIIIKNYEQYQGNDTADDTADDTAEGQQKDSRRYSNNKDKKEKKEKKKIISDEDFIQALKTNSAYKGIDIDRELARMDAWFLTPNGQGRKKTRRFILNWLNKIDIPIPAQERGNGVVL